MSFSALTPPRTAYDVPENISAKDISQALNNALDHTTLPSTPPLSSGAETPPAELDASLDQSTPFEDLADSIHMPASRVNAVVAKDEARTFEFHHEQKDSKVSYETEEEKKRRNEMRYEEEWSAYLELDQSGEPGGRLWGLEGSMVYEWGRAGEKDKEERRSELMYEEEWSVYLGLE